MKTMKKGDSIVRVTDKEADDKLRFGWSFCPKNEWKTNVRDFGKSSKKDSKKKDQELEEK